MTYRKFDTCTWIDPWFEKLSTHAKLAFVYLWTNDHCNQAGIYTISAERIEFDLGYKLQTVEEELQKKVEWFSSEYTVWVKNFFRHQCQNYSFAVSAINSIKCDSFKLQIFINHNSKLLINIDKLNKGYGIDMV